MLNTKWISRVEWLVVSIVLLLTVSALLIVRTTHPGALWRDECGLNLDLILTSAGTNPYEKCGTDGLRRLAGLNYTP